MIAALIAAQVFSWVVILGMGIAMVALARQIGVLHIRMAPAGALTPAKGPAVGEKSPKLELTGMDGARVSIGSALAKGHKQLLMFVSPHCPICKDLIPVAKSFVKHENLDVVFMGDDDAADIRAMITRTGIEGMPFVNSPTVGRMFHVDKLPHAVLIGEDGSILSKGLVNSREHLESLVVSHEMGVVSVQDYLASLKSKVA
jgi:methylamine dehydrogenase accessory protein MauD